MHVETPASTAACMAHGSSLSKAVVAAAPVSLDWSIYVAQDTAVVYVGIRNPATEIMKAGDFLFRCSEQCRQKKKKVSTHEALGWTCMYS